MPRLAARPLLAILVLPVLASAPAQAGAAGASVTGTVQVLEKGGGAPHPRADNAVVWLSVPESAPRASPVVVNQAKKKFRPRVLPVVKGQVVHFMNQDRLEHNVFSRSGARGFDLGRYPKGEFRPVTFDKPGVFKVYCNIHKAMILDVVVLENDHFAVTDEDGVFAIDAVPPGRYEVWHIYGGTHRRNLEIASEPLVIDPITITSTKVVREVAEHLDKRGRPYSREKTRYPRR